MTDALAFVAPLLVAIGLMVAGAVLVAEVVGGFGVVARAIVRRAARRLPKGRERWEEEWLGHLKAKSGRPISSIVQALKFYRDAGEMRGILLPHIELSPVARAAKRLIDLAVVVPALILLAPLMLVIAVAVKLRSPGPVFYRQIRVGIGGRRIQCVKFRTMVQGAESLEHTLRARDKAFIRDLARRRRANPLDDPRVITRLGARLRRWSLDELPQLFNVLRGDMTLVGPRAVAPEDEDFAQHAVAERPSLKPGLTGPSQILDERPDPATTVETDWEYTASWSIWRDLKILALTIAVALKPRR